MKVGSHEIDVSNQGKVFYPDADYTKGDLIDYYYRIGETMIVHTRDRPISMQRFPDGIHESGFYEKKAPDYFPSWIRTVEVELEEGGKQDQIVIDDVATLVYLADQACITPHIWLSRAGQLQHPDKLIFDLDPPGDDFEIVRNAARDLKDILDEVELMSYVMTTGSKGLHVAVPLDRGQDFDMVREFARDLAEVLAARRPDEYTVEIRKNKRKERLFLDFLRNSFGQTSVPPYAVRPIPGAPVATPLDWDELSDHSLDSQTYNIGNIFRRLGQKEDPWKDFLHHARSLKQARQDLDEIMEKEKE